jgi:hypothetical protein
MTALVLAAVLCTSLVSEPQGGPPADLSFESLHRAENDGWYRIRQVRYVIDRDPHSATDHWLGIREQLRIAPPEGPSGSARFSLQLISTFGDAPPVEAQRQSEIFNRHAAFLQQHSGFRVVDPDRAAQNYALRELGMTTRLGRQVARVAVVPRALDRAIWMLEVDVETGYPLYRAEHDGEGRLLSAIEVICFEHGEHLRGELADTLWWRTADATDHPSMPAALAALGAAGTGLPTPSSSLLPDGYAFERARTVLDSLTGERSLVLIYTDGVDEMFCIETPGVLAPSFPLLAPDPEHPAYAIVEFQDRNLSQLMFHARGTRFLVVGRVAHSRLRSFTENVLRETIAAK